MAEACVLYGSQGSSLLFGGGSWRPGILSLVENANKFIFRFVYPFDTTFYYFHVPKRLRKQNNEEFEIII